ncbi:MAG: glycosyltransferase family 39 protein [Halobacteriales archaeon]|nr:glycosyltransferase family 39 protein [Halobacteriales archaeon]
MTRPRRLLVPVVVLAAAIRFAGLGAESLWIDEIITVRFLAEYTPLELLTVIPSQQPHFPPYYVFLDLWSGLFGRGAVRLRFPSAVAGTLSVPVAYLLVRRLYTAPAGLLAAATLAVSRYHIADAQEVRMYAFVTLGVLASTYAFTRLDEGRRLHVAYLGLTLFALSLHPFAVFLPLVHATFLAIERVAPASAGTWTAPDTSWPVALASLPILVVGIFGIVSFLGGARLTFVAMPGAREIAVVLGSFFGRWPWPWNLAIGGGCGLLALGGLWAGRREPATRLLACWLAVPIAGLLAISYLATPVLFDRYAVVAAPAFPLLAVRGVLALGSPESVDIQFATARAVQLAVAGCLLLALASSGVALHTTTDKEEWNAAVETVESRADDGALVVVSDCITRRAYTYYADRTGLTVIGSVGPESGTPHDRTPAAALRLRMAAHEEVWLVFSHVADREERRLQQFASERHEKRLTREFVGITVVGYEQPANETVAAGTISPTGCDVRIGK